MGVSICTLRRCKGEGEIISEHTAGCYCCYDLSKLRLELFRSRELSQRKTIVYTRVRVSSNDQKDDLERQKQVFKLYGASQGWIYELISDLESGMNYRKKGLKRLLDALIENEIGRLGG
ncbi:hypothetical protein GCM10023261_08610 [Bartonella jaculi]|uniref:Resolvase/invertase-type recombinase catalytic domain-containing protein n=1 Tax=Bartonella jaculi TaxID=686226 RepID=A0ABP9N456_9HYPH